MVGMLTNKIKYDVQSIFRQELQTLATPYPTLILRKGFWSQVAHNSK